MKKLLLITLFFLLGCNSVNESIVIDRDDAEWNAAALYQAEECIQKSSILQDIEEYSEFDNSPFSAGDIFKISQDTDLAVITYVRINAINGSDMILEFNSNKDEYDKRVLFSETEYKKLEDIFKDILCSPVYADKNFSASSSSGRFTWDKYTVDIADDDDDDVDEQFKDIRDSLTINTEYPLFFYYFNGSKVKKEIPEDGAEVVNSTSNITISDGKDSSTCDTGTTEPCVFTGLATSTCTLTVDTNAIDDTGADSDFIKNAGDCDFLNSNEK